jgi:hypothetical protein
MKSLAVVVSFSLCAAVLPVTVARADNLTCGDLANSLLQSPSSCSDRNGNQTADAFESGLGIGSVLGVVDLVAGLICLGESFSRPANPQCGCAKAVVERNADEFVQRLADRLSECVAEDPRRAGWAPILDTVRDLCPF